MKISDTFPRRLAARRILPLALLALPAACGGGGGGSSVALFDPNNTKESVAASSIVVVDGKRLAFQADESVAGVDFNGNGNSIDLIAVAVDMGSSNGKETVLNVAVKELAIAGGNTYMAVDEAVDGFDWSQDGQMDDFVLLVHPKKDPNAITSPNATKVEYVDDLEVDGTVHLLSVEKRLYYTRPDGVAATLVNGDSSLAYLTTAAPTTPVTVTVTPATYIALPRILGERQSLIFLFQDEGDLATDLNADTDTGDEYVLALLNGTLTTAALQSVGWALADESEPFDADSTGTNDWLVGFLVDEASQADFPNGLNDPSNGALGFGASWLPDNCPAYVDTDATDQVLFFLEFKNWFLDPTGPDKPHNTGVPGDERVICMKGAVATLVQEVEDGGCDLNNNGETDDEVVRWVNVATPNQPEGDPDLIVAVEDVPGGAHGVTMLDDKLIAIVSESEEGVNYDNDAGDHNLLGWLNPADGAGAQWTFDHSTTTQLYFGCTWLAKDAVKGLIMLAFQERVFNLPAGGQDLNGDGDKLDVVPSTALFGSATDLDFFWPGVATVPDNAGLEFFNNVLFFRVDEFTDDRNFNGDNDKNDIILARTSYNGANFLSLDDDNNIPDTGSMTGGGTIGAGWIADEGGDFDFNKDGDKNDRVLRWCRIGS